MKQKVSLFLAAVLLLSTLALPACKSGIDTGAETTAPIAETTPNETTGETTPTVTTSKGDDPVTPEEQSNATLYDLRVESMLAPVGIDDTNPVFSWKTLSDELGWAQSAYRIEVKTADRTVWDSGEVASGTSVGIEYAGETLTDSTEYVWTVTVLDKNGKKATASSTFETGLFGKNAFSDAYYISYEDAPLYEGTTYTIDFDFVIESDNQGFCFSMQDSGTFVMWQVNTYNGKNSDGKIWLRPHFKSGGSWTAYPGGPGSVQAIDVTAAIGYSASEVIGKTIHERIEVNGRTVKTYFGKDENSLTLASTYTHSTALPLYDIGFRHNSDSSNDKEVAGYANIVVRDGNGNILYQSDFENGTNDYIGASCASLDNGMLTIGTTESTGEFVFTRMDGEGLPVFRKEVEIKSDLVSAKLYTSGLGVYEAYINGERIGRLYEDGSVEYHELKPGFTEMEDRKFYSSYDVTWMLEKGKVNTLSAIVSSGWWSDAAARSYGTEDAFLAKLVLTYADGSTETVTTDTSWKTARAAAVVYADIFSGETYDARISQAWMKSDFDDTSWANASLNLEFVGEIVSWSGSYITVREDLTLDTKSVTVFDGVTGESSTAYGKINTVAVYGDEAFTLQKGETAVIDFGQNFAGWEAITVEGKAGTVLTIEHGETLNDQNGAYSRGCDGPEGSIYNANYRSAAATTRYTLSGNGVESYHPSFTFYGFRYIEITATDTVTIHAVKGMVVTSVDTDTGFMTTSDEDVNQLISNIRWGQYSNYLSVPTDCPQRDERQGWTADTQVFAQAGSYMAFSKSFLEKFMMDMRDSQNSEGAYPGTAPTGEYSGGGWGGLGWADAGIIVPYTLYTMYGDRSVILENWDSMQLYVDGYLATTNKKGPSGIWGDWLSYEPNDDALKALLGVAFYAWDAMMMAEMAEAIGLDDEAERYWALYETEKAYFIEQYVTSSGTLKLNRQTACLYALYLDLLPDENSVTKVTNQLVNNIVRNGNKLQTGFLGTAIILKTLTKVGRSDVAYTLLLQHDNPSWLYSVDQGATTIWERWNSYTIESGFGDVSMNSFNHYAYGAVAAWMFESMAGIGQDPDDPGFKNVLIAPQPDTRLAVEASYDSAYGVITAKSSFEGSIWTYSFSLPANTTADVTIPVKDEASTTVNGKALSALTLEEDGIVLIACEGGVATFEAVAGSFTVIATLAN